VPSGCTGRRAAASSVAPISLRYGRSLRPCIASTQRAATTSTHPVRRSSHDEGEQRLRDLSGYGIDADLVARAGDEAIVLHCLPAHYGEEITEEVVYGPQSAIFDQAENRLHTQKALLALIVP